MVKFYEKSFNFAYGWDQVAQVFWDRYPNPHSKHVLSEDVIKREVGANGVLYTTRLLTKTNHMPKWGERFWPNKLVSVIEESIVDPKNKTICTYTRNFGYSMSIMSVEEKCVYRPSDLNPTLTIVDKRAWISSRVFGFGYAIQAFSLERFKKNALRAVEGYNFALRRTFPRVDGAEVLFDYVMVSSKDQLMNKARETAKKASDLAKNRAAIVAQCNTNEA